MHRELIEMSMKLREQGKIEVADILYEASKEICEAIDKM
jgi:hypothetical protein